MKIDLAASFYYFLTLTGVSFPASRAMGVSKMTLLRHSMRTEWTLMGLSCSAPKRIISVSPKPTLKFRRVIFNVYVTPTEEVH